MMTADMSFSVLSDVHNSLDSEDHFPNALCNVKRNLEPHASSTRYDNLCLSLEGSSIWEAAHVVHERTLVAEELDVSTVGLEVTIRSLGNVLLTGKRSEAPLLADDDLLTAWELVLSTAESLNGIWSMDIPRPHGQDNLTNVHTRHKTVRLAESTTHTCLQSIGTSARQHLVDADDMVRMCADTQMEGFLTRGLHHVLVGADTGGLESLGGELFILIGDEVDAVREIVDGSALAAEIVNSDLGVGDTTVEPRLGVRLVLAIAVATSWTSGHLCYCL